MDSSIDSLIRHVGSVSGDTGIIRINLEAAVIVKDSFSDYTDVFLVPDQGNNDIIKLHDRLYTGILKNELKLDIAFIPHIGIGVPEKQKNSDELNKNNFNIQGKKKSLDLVEYEYPKLRTIEKFNLQETAL